MSFLDRFRPSIISIHILKTYLPPFLVGVSFFSFVILLFNLRFAIKAAIEKGVETDLVLELMTYSMGWTLGLTVPMSAILGTIISISSLNSDYEVVAMRAGGMTYRRIFRPYFIFSLLVSFFMIWYQFEVIPACSRGMSTLTAAIYDYNPTAVIEPGQFIALGEGSRARRFIYVEFMEKNKKGYDVLKNIQVRTTAKEGRAYVIQELIFAKEGRKIEKTLEDGATVKAIRLYNGYLLFNNKSEDSFRRMDFSTGTMDLNLTEASNTIKAQKNQSGQVNAFSRRELEEAIIKYKGVSIESERALFAQLKVEYHKRVALPMSIVLFSFLGFPIGIVNRRSGKGMGLGQSVIFIFLYFVIYLSSDSVAVVNLDTSPALIAWLANIVIFTIGLMFFTFKTSELPAHPRVRAIVGQIAKLNPFKTKSQVEK